MKRLLFSSLTPYFLVGLLFSSCASYKQNIMFKVPEGQALKTEVEKSEKSYTIQKFDFLELEVYTNQGERLIDPEVYLKTERPNTEGDKEPTKYMVDEKGIAKLPMVGEINLEGISLRKAEELLQKEYAKFFKDPFVILKNASKRVFVLGAPGGQVIPLSHENTTLIEVLAMAKGIDNNAKAFDIRVLRADDVYVVDLSTIDGYKKGKMILEPGDVVYVEPIRRPFSEGLSDYAPAFAIITSMATLIIVIISL